MSNIFKQFRNYQSRKVDNPSYEPLGQSITIGTPVEDKKKKRNEYAKEYYRKNKNKIRKLQREYWRKKHADGNHRGDMIGIQKRVYEYLLDQYRKGEDPARGTEIAKALGVSDNSVYTAVFQLTKKGYLGRGTYGRYLLLKFPDGEVSKEEKKVASKRYSKHIDGEDYSPGYVGQLKHSIKTGQKIINGMREEIESLNKKLEEKELELQNSGSKDDKYESNLISRLENQNAEMKIEIEELKSAIKTLSRYID